MPASPSNGCCPKPGPTAPLQFERRMTKLLAPSLVHAEIGSAIWRAVLRGDVPAAEARRDLKVAVGHYRRIIPLAELADRALELAMRLRHPIYDCFYLALAERERCPLITADRRLIAAAKALKGIELRPL